MLALAHPVKTDPLDAWARLRMARDHIPAMAVGIYRNGKPLEVKVYGIVDLERGAKARRDSPFEICSITKQFTAAAVLLLAEEGKLSLDDSLAKWYPEAPRLWKAITLRDCLGHLTGLSDPLVTDAIAGKDWNESLKAFMAAPPVRPPRVRWQYNNSGYALLRPIVERAGGEPFWTFLKRRIFVPLGMRHTRPNERGIETGRVRGYLWEDGRYLNADPLWADVGTSAGGLLSTVDDLALWSEALRKGTILKPASRAAMLTPGRLRANVAAWNESAEGYGLGVFLRTVDGRTVEKHSGGWNSASAQLTRLPDEGLTLVVLTNRGQLPERPWWGEELAEIATGRRYLPSIEPVSDPEPGRTARVRTMAEKAGWKLGPLRALGFVRAIPQGDATALEFRGEFDAPCVVTAWERAGKLEDLQHFDLPKTR